jgi:hypothetical protein
MHESITDQYMSTEKKYYPAFQFSTLLRFKSLELAQELSNKIWIPRIQVYWDSRSTKFNTEEFGTFQLFNNKKIQYVCNVTPAVHEVSYFLS